MKDCIVDKDGAVIARIDYRAHENIPHYFSASIAEYAVPDDLAALLDSYSAILDGGLITLLDDVEAAIYQFDLRLLEAGSRIFNVEIKDRKRVNFFTKYPTSDGFVDSYPG